MTMTITITMKIIQKMIFVFIALTATVALAGDAGLLKKCKVDVTWNRHGEDAVVTVTVTNKTGKKLVDPSVRVTFYDAEEREVGGDSKTYFKTVPPGAKKKFEARIFSYVPAEAKTAKGVVEGGVLK
ncbi:MAG: hypothetical protein HQ472_04470 [Ignavibacteria bacterium]|nr:hypothetical protein [Ignavibacteria bacterium]